MSSTLDPPLLPFKTSLAYSSHFHPDRLQSLLAPLKQHGNQVEQQQEEEEQREIQAEVLQPGMVLLRNFLSVELQKAVIDCVTSLDREPGKAGFYIPLMTDGAPYDLHMMSVGQHWNSRM